MVKKMPEAPLKVQTIGLYQLNGLLRTLYLTIIANEAYLTELSLFYWPSWCNGTGWGTHLQAGH